jgi:hypothetical protein
MKRVCFAVILLLSMTATGSAKPPVPWVVAKVISVQHQSDVNATDIYDITLEYSGVLYYGEARFHKVDGPLFSSLWLPDHRPQLTENTLIRVQIKDEKFTVMDDKSREYPFLLVKKQQEPIQ